MRQLTLIWYAVVVAAVSANASDKGEWWKVDIAQGPVRGQRDTKADIYIFYNIPYAKAPTGEHKFKAPLPPPTWTEPYDAIDKGIACPQYPNFLSMFKNLKSQENCLVANVYVPNTETKNLSVLVLVHGGGFQVGYGDWYKAKNFMKSKDLIVVSFNYRLGIHGFLCLGTEDIPGNAGMKDQVALLRWVQQNIAAFGGNPNDVTIDGSSAGSVSVDLLMISKSAEGLFHKVIPESGVSLAAFAIQVDPLRVAKEYAKAQNFSNIEDINALDKFYKTLSYDILTADPFFSQLDATFMFSPCVERNTGEGVFLTESPFSILKKGSYKKVPLLYGFANMEGLLRMYLFDTAWKDRMNVKFSDFLPADLMFETQDERETVAKQVKDFYFGDKPINNDNVLKFVDYFSDVFIVYSTLKAVKLHVEAGHKELYLYEYSFVDADTPVVPHTNVRGATHCAQSFAVLDGINATYSFEDHLTNEYKLMKKTMREIWHNFLKTGKPIPNESSLPAWPSVGLNRSPHMALRQPLELRGKLLEERFQFWDDIYKKHYREPIPPSHPSPSKASKS